MKKYILIAKEWFEFRVTREKLFILAFAWAFIYALFSLFLFGPLQRQNEKLMANIKSINSQINVWEIQINALNKIAHSPLYQQWLKQRQIFQHIQGQYKNLLHTMPNNRWQDIIKTILQSQNNITLVQIKNDPEVAYNPTGILITSVHIYKQRFMITVYSNFFDTLSYLQRLEQLLPNVHWDSLSYQVFQYPVAKIEMEFSVFYDKNV